MDDTSKAAVLSLARSILIAVGGYIVAHGLVDEKEINEAVGLLMVVAPLAWGMIDKFVVERATKKREMMAVNAGISKSNSEPGETPHVVSTEAATGVIETFRQTRE